MPLRRLCLSFERNECLSRHERDHLRVETRPEGQRGDAESRGDGVFGTLTGIGLGVQGGQRLVLSPADPAQAVEDAFAEVTWRDLSPDEVLGAIKDAPAENIQGPQVHDWMHVRSAELAKCVKVVTSNVRHFAGKTRLKVSTASEHFADQSSS